MTQTPTATISRRVGKWISVTQANTPRFVRVMGLLLSPLAIPAAAFTTAKTRFVAFTISVSGLANVTRSVGKTVLVTRASVVTIAKRYSFLRVIDAVTGGAVTMTRHITKTVAAQAAQVMRMAKVITKTVTAQAAQAMAMAKVITRTITTSTSATVTITTALTYIIDSATRRIITIGTRLVNLVLRHRDTDIHLGD